MKSKSAHFGREQNTALARFTSRSRRLASSSASEPQKSDSERVRTTLALSKGVTGGPLAFHRSHRLALILACDN
eukprot:3155208-Pleurochrysis_carterae.AAC.1